MIAQVIFRLLYFFQVSLPNRISAVIFVRIEVPKNNTEFYTYF